jgi:hypothetical protein
MTSTKPLVDYSKSILLALDAYLRQMEHLSTKHTEATKSKDARKLAIEEWKRKREEEKVCRCRRRRNVMRQRRTRLER